MPINSKIKSLYDALKADGADVGSEQEFSDWFQAPGEQGYNNRKYVYDTFKADGADVGKNYEEFAGWLGLHAVQPQVAQAGTMRQPTGQTASAGHVVEEPRQEVQHPAQVAPREVVATQATDKQETQGGFGGGKMGGGGANTSWSEVTNATPPPSPVIEPQQPTDVKQKIQPAELTEKEVGDNLAFMREVNRSQGDIPEDAPQDQNGRTYWMPHYDKNWKAGYSQSWGKINELFDGLDYGKKDATSSLDAAVNSRYDGMSDQAIESELQKLSKEYKAGEWDGVEDSLIAHINRLQMNLIAHEYGFKNYKDMMSRRGEAEYEMYKYHPAFDQEWLATYDGGPGENPLVNMGKEIVKKQLIEDTMNGVPRPEGYYQSLPFRDKEFSKRYASWALKRAKALGNMGFADVYNNGIKTWESYIGAGLLESGAEEAMAQGAGYSDVGIAGGKYNADFDAAAATAWGMAEDEYRRLTGTHNNEIWGDYASMGGGREARMVASGEWAVSNMADRLSSHDLDKMIDNAWKSLGESKQKQIVLAAAQNLKQQYPGMSPAEMVKTAQSMVRQQTIQRVLDYAKEQNAPKNVVDYFARKVLEQNSIFKIQEAMARNRAGTTGDWQARDMAMQEYGKNHRIAGIAGTVVGMGLDPVTYISAGVGKGAAAGTVKLIEKLGGAAGRKWLTTTAGKVVVGAAGGAANLGTFEGLNETLNQLRWGGSPAVDLKTGLIKTTGYDAGEVGKAIFHGTTMGAGTGIVAPLVGNVWSPFMEATSSTAGKMAVKTGELFTGTIAEGTIFSIPDVYNAYTESENIIKSFSDKKSRNYISDEQERAKAIAKVRESRNETMLDAWSESVATMAGFKMKHVGQRLYELSQSGNGRAGFETRLRYMLDRKPDLALTKDEQAELERGGYADLKELADEYVEAEKNRRANSKPVVTGKPRPLELGTREEDMPYNRFVDLMNDGSISEAARAKMYYYITGHALPMSTVMYGQLTENKDRDGNVKGYTVQSIGANGVVTSREFTSRKRAENELQKVNRQIELNTIDIGERYNESFGDAKRMEQACKNAAKEAAGGGINFRFGENSTLWIRYYDIMRKKPEEMSAEERGIAQKIRDAYDKLGDEFEYEEYIYETNRNIFGINAELVVSAKKLREDIGQKYDVDVEKALKKEPKRRSAGEQMALDEYMRMLFPEKEAREEDAEDVTFSEDTSVTDETTNGFTDETTDESDAIVVETLNRTGEDGMIHPAVLKGQDEVGVDIVSGNVVTLADGTIDVANSDPDIVVVDANGERQMVSINDIASVGDVVDPNAVVDAAVQANTPVTGVEVGGSYQVMAEDNVPHQVEVLRDNGNGTLMVRVDGAEEPQPMVKAQLEQMLGIEAAAVQQPTEQTAAGVLPPTPSKVEGELVQNADEADVPEAGSERYSVDPNADGRAMGMAGFSEQDIAATVDYLNGKLGEREYLETVGISADTLDATSDEQIASWVNSIVERASEFITDATDEAAAVQPPTGQTADGTNQADAATTATPEPVGTGIFGNIYDQFKGKVKEAIGFLLGRKEGVAKGALHHKDVGDIDLWYGNDNAGLKKIAEKHPEVLQDLQGIIDGMHIKESTDNRIILESDTHKAVVSKDWYGKKADNWLLTAYEKKDASGGSIDIGPEPQNGKQNGTAPLQDNLSQGKGSENISSVQAEDEKSEAMPMLEDGNPDYSQVDASRTHDYLYSDESGLVKSEADEYVQAQIDAAEKALSKIDKKPLKMGTDLAKYRAEKQRRQEQLDAAKANVDYWERVKAIEADREAQAAAERKAKDAEVIAQAQAEEAQRQAEELAKQQEQAERGSGAVHTAIAEKWDNAPKIEGYKDEVVLANGERVPGTYYLVESGAVTPSHNASREFEKYEGFPVDENGNTINDRDYERDKDAQNITRSIADNYDSRALQTPVIVSKDGVVLSGNGRTMAGELAASNNTDGAYIEHLKNYGRKYGFSPEQVTSMKHPRAVFVPDADMPYTTDTFAKFNAQEMKGQSKTEQAVKLGKVVDDATFNQIVRSINEYETLPKFYANKEDATVDINALRKAGAINDMQYAEMFDGDAVSDRGRQIIENMLIGKAFEGNPDVIRMLTEYKSFRQSVVTALNEISTNVALGKDYSLENELAQAIELAYKARKAGFKENELVSPYATQLNLFPFEDGETVADYNNAAVLLLADMLNDKRPTLLKKKLQDYNQQSAESAAGQMDIFAGGVKEKKEIIKTVLNTLHNGETEETSRPEQRGSVADERGGEASLQEDGAAGQPEQGESNIQGLESYSEDELRVIVEEHVRSAIADADMDAEITGIRFIGSRTTGTARADSDLDVLVEYQGTAREDSLFNVLNDEDNRLVIDGITVDINPITPGKSGTIEEFMKRNAGYKKETTVQEQIALAEQQTETTPSEAQKEAGNYKKGHVKIDGFEISIEQPKGSVRSGVDASGKSWRQKMNNTYGYIRGTEGVDGDHIDVFLSDDPSQGDVFVVDQVNNDGSFDEHKVMYGFNSEEEARQAYLSNYEDGWQGLGAITAVSKDEFKKWIGSSHRKTKPFAEYKNVKVEGEQAAALRQPTGQKVDVDTHPVSTAKSSQKSEVAEAPKERIDDVGEKIEGAKKDLAQKMGERINLDADTFPKMFPKYDLKQFISQGLDPSLAVMTKMLRQMAQADYKHYSKKRMYGKSYALRAARFYAAYAKQVLEAGDSNVDFKSEGLGFTDYGKQFVELNKRLFEELYNKLGDDLFDLDLAGVKIQPLSQKEGSTWFRRNQETGEMEPYNPAYAFVGPRGQNYYEANELDKALQEGVEQVSKSIDYKKTHPYKLGHYYKPGVKNSDYVGVKLGGKIVPLTEPMTSSEVRKYMSEHNAELQAKAAQLDEQRKLDKKKGGTGEGRWKPELTLGGGRPRVGADRRGGVDIEAEEFMKSFGFRGVQFGNYVTQRERQRFLNEAYDALMDMAELLGISPRALAIDGRLGLAIGARGGGKANAHYEPKENAINLTKSKGAGSLAHEWFHALDYYFNKSSNRPTASTANKSAEQFPASTRDEMRKAFLDLMRAIKNSDYYNRSVALEQKLHPQQLGEGYYDKPTELGARAFQDYVVRKLTDQGKINDFLSSFTSEKDWNGEPENYPYPVGAEAEKIDEKFDALFDAMQERTDEEGNIILYHLGKDHDVLTDTEVALRDGLVEVLRGAGIEVVTDEAEGQRVLDAANRAADVLDEMKKRNQQQETALPEDESSFKGTAISSADGAKVQQIVDTSKDLPGKIREMRTWHGSGADFDAFDHAHMGEGEGAQAYGWGTYVTEVEGIARSYAEDNAKKPPYLSVAKRHRNTAYENFIYSRNAVESCKRDIENYEKRITANKEYIEELEDSRAYILKEHGESSVELENWDFLGQEMLSQVREEIEADKERIASSREYLQNLEKMLPYLESEYEKAKAEVLRLDAMTKRYLYEVDIPDNDGTNYLPFDKPLTDEQLERIASRLGDEDAADFRASYQPVADAPNADEVNAWSRRGENILRQLSWLFGHDGRINSRAASEFLHDCGFVGIEYPAQYRSGGRSDGTKNYVIFDEGDLKINSKTQFFRTGSGEVYGFVRDGKIYIDPRVASAETPVHEYSHLWADALKRANPEAWERLKETMLGEKDVLEYVKRLYPELEGDELLGEVFSHYSGKRGAERLRAEMDREMKNAEGVFAKARVARVFDIIKRELSRFWTMARDLFAGKTRGLDRLTAEDFADMAMNDLLRGFKPSVAERTKGERGSSIVFERGSSYRKYTIEDKKYQEAVNSGDMAKAERLFKDAAKRAMPDTKVVDENGKPKVVYHQTNRKEYINKETGQNWDDLDWKEREEWDNRSDEEWEATWEERDFNTFDNRYGRQSSEYPAFFFSPEEDPYHEYGKRTIAAYLNIKNPAIDPDIPNRGVTNTAGKDAMQELIAQGYDGVIRTEDGVPYEYIAFFPNQIKSAETVTYDDNGNVIPLSERFNEDEPDIRGRQGIYVNERGDIVNAEGDIELDKPTLRNWVKNLPTLNKVKRHGDAVSIYDEEDLGNLKGLVSDELYEAVESGLKSPIQRGTCDLDSGFIAIYTGKLKTAFETESTWWHENTHLAFDAIELADKDELGLAALAYVKEHDKSYKNFDRMMRNYRKEQLPGEGACRLIQYIYKNWGAQGIINGDFVGNEKIAKLATAIQNYLFYGETREEETENRLRQSSTNTGGEYAEPRPRIRFDSEQGGEEIQPRGKRGNEEEVEGSRFLKEEGEIDDSGISDEELAGYDAGRYSFAESITQGLVDLALKNTHDQQLRLNAMREFGGNLAKLRKIMNKQKAYDKGTVDDIVRLARMVMGSGFFKDMSAYEVKRLLAAIKKGVGAEDLTPIANNVVDMLVQHQLRESKAMLHKLMQVRGRKVDARGVEVQAGLDIDGQRMMSALKDGMSLGENGLLTRINDCENRLGSEDEVIRKNAMSEYQGLMLAKEYHDNILSGEEEEIVLRNEKHQEQEKIYDFRREPVLDDDGNAIINQDGSVRTVERKTLKPQFKNNVTDENKQLRRNTEAAIERIEQSIRESRMERVTSYIDFMSDVAGDVRASRERAAEWRAEQQQRVDEIHHNANSDLEGVPVQSQVKLPEGGLLAFNSNNDIVRLLFQPLATFEKMLRFFGRKSHNGEGYLFNRFMRGWADCSDKEWRSKRAAHEELDAKVRELFGKKAKRWSDLYEVERNKKHPGIPVEYWDNGERVRETMSQGEALSLVVWSNQKDAEAGLRRMGISEEDIETIKSHLDPKFLQLANWVVEEFLPKRREYYNEVHERMFGAPMAAIEHYFPIVRNSRDVEKPSDITERDLGETKPSTITGNIIKRQRTAAALDVHTDFFDHLLKHLDDMENWAAWAEFNRDINTLRNYKRFKNRVLNMHSVEFGSGKDLWKAFDDACAIAAGVYHPSTKRGSGDNLAVNVAKGVTGAKIAFRFYTAAKQLLSLPAFWNGDASLLELAKWENPVGAIIAWNWAMKNLPGFSKRWQSRQVGDVRLMDTDSDYAFWRNNMVRALSRGGMWANALVDGMTVAMGARAVYETHKKRYLRNGYSEEQAEKRAMQDAAINYNSSQQSSENAFLSSLQLDRTWWSTLMTVFRSASMGYQRRLTTGLRNLKNRMKKGYKAESIEFMKKQMMRDGIDEATAEKAARRTYRWGGLRSMADVFVFGLVLPFFWNLGPYALYLLMGDDDDEKKDMLKDAAVHSLFGPAEGLTGGQAMSEIGNTWAGYLMSDNDKSLLNALRYHDYLSMPLGSDLQQIFNEAGTDSMAAWTDAFNLLVQAGIGVNPETFTDAWVAIADACDGDPQITKEFALCFMRVMQVPQTQVDKLFVDELGMTARDAQKLNAMEMADRYAKYKKFRNAPLLNWAYSADESQKVAEKYRKRFLDNMQERMERLDDEQLEWNFANPNDSERRKAVGKVYAKGKGVKDSAGQKPASNWKPETRRSQLKYQRLRDWTDLAEDVLLDTAIEQAKNRGDDEKLKALRDAKKELTEIKRGKHTETWDIDGLGDGSAEDDKAIMDELRARRKELLRELGVL